MKKTAIVTGGSSGIGRAACEALAAQGYRVFELSRGTHKEHGAAAHIPCDVTDGVQVENAIHRIISETGTIDLVVNCAGFGISGAIEFTDTEAAKRLFDVDFFGTVRVNQAVIPYMREQGRREPSEQGQTGSEPAERAQGQGTASSSLRSRQGGRIINISSVAGAAPIPFQAFYSAAKAAVSSYTLSLANELRDFGISVCAIQPGDVRTGFTSAREKQHRGNEIYGGVIDKSVAKMEKDEKNGYEPAFLGRYIAKVAAKKSVRPLYTPGALYKAAAYLLKFLPARLSNWIISKLYIVR